MLSGCSAATLNLPSGAGGSFARALTDASVTYERSADGVERWSYTSAPNAMASEMMALVRTLAAVVARTGAPIQPPPERLVTPEPR